jgi:hypothetical protein
MKMCSGLRAKLRISYLKSKSCSNNLQLLIIEAYIDKKIEYVPEFNQRHDQPVQISSESDMGLRSKYHPQNEFGAPNVLNYFIMN